MMRDAWLLVLVVVLTVALVFAVKQARAQPYEDTGVLLLRQIGACERAATARIDELQKQVAALTKERDEAKGPK